MAEKKYASWVDIPNGSPSPQRIHFRDDDAMAGILHPVDISTLTPSSTFVENAVVGINGVIYRAKKATSNFPVSLLASGNEFVVDVVNGKVAYVVVDDTINNDWEQWTDAAIEYWTEQLAARAAALESAQTALAARTTTIEGTLANVTYNGRSYSVRDILNAMAALMPRNVVTQ